MDEMSPAVNPLSSDVTKCDGIEITANLFKDHKMSVNTEIDKNERLHTFLRIRALNDIKSDTNNNCFKIIDSTNLLVIPPKGSNANKYGIDSDQRQFTFTKIFGESVDQLTIYENCALPIVKRFLCGENCLLFAYGITSSGKSYTMRGIQSNPGIIPRSLKTIFDIIGHRIVTQVPNVKPYRFTDYSALSKKDMELEESVRTFIFDTSEKQFNSSINLFRSQMSSLSETSSDDNQWNDYLHSTFRSNESYVKCCLWITFYEIYNEIIYDLLDFEVSGERKQSISILKDDMQNYFVKGLRHVFVSTPEEAYKVLLFGQNNLHISSTHLNNKSSRSHCAFNISLVRLNANSEHISVNNLTLCDLAGAERSEKANNTGVRIREAGKINGSLLSLSRCLAALRANQSDRSKMRFVNYRDSKLTKVFQPFLNGSGITSMIMNMNPINTLFDETFYALKFTGVASQIVVTTEEQQNRFQNSLKRLTQMWMQSSQRWSNFAHMNPPSLSIIQDVIEEEDESDNNDNVVHNMTYEEFEKRANELSELDLTKVAPEELEILRTQIDFLSEKLAQTENEKMDQEFKLRKQLAFEFDKLYKDMEEMAKVKDQSKKRLEEMMNQRIIRTENIHKEEKLKLEKRINDLENDLYKDKEGLCHVTEQYNQLLEENQLLKNDNIQLKAENEKYKQLIEQFEVNNKNDVSLNAENEKYKKLAEELEIVKQNVVSLKAENQLLQSEKDSLKESITNCDKSTSFAILYSDKSTIVNNSLLLSTDCSSPSTADRSIQTNKPNFKDSNTSTSFVINTEDKCSSPLSSSAYDISIQTNELNMKDLSTSTSFIIKTEDKCSSPLSSSTYDRSIQTNEPNMKDLSTSTSFIFKAQDKSICNSPLSSSTYDISSQTIGPNMKELSTSTSLIFKTEDKCTSPLSSSDNFISKVDFEIIKNEYENKLKEKDAMIAFNREIVNQRDQELKKIKDEQMSEKNHNRDTNFENIFKNLNRNIAFEVLRSNSIASSSVSVKSEDTISNTSAASLALKAKRKYSSRKKKTNLNTSIENRYLSAVGETNNNNINCEPLSQSSVNSDVVECIQDEIGNIAYSTHKKKNERKSNKRRQQVDNYSNNEDIIKVPESKRKKPIKNLSVSPISPIPSEEVVKRVTRSRVRKAIKF